MFQLANSDKYLTVSDWQGATLVHIRTYFNPNQDGSGQMRPTKKGIALMVDEWKALKSYVEYIDAQVGVLEDDRKSTQLRIDENAAPPNNPDYQPGPQSLIPEPCQAKAIPQMVSRQLTKIRRVTPYQRPREPEPFDQ